MCLINFHFQQHSKYKLIVVSNRDEEYHRPTKEAQFWEDHPYILGGRDLLKMGTWLGITKQGKFAALTNYRDPRLPDGPISRGEIVKNFLTNDMTPVDYIHYLKEHRKDYGGYNVLIGSSDQLIHYNNVFDEINEITPGTYSLSNSSLNTPWPKVIKGKNKLQKLVNQYDDEIVIENLFNLNYDCEIANDTELPNTGVGIELERLLSPMFIQMPNYGTRTTTIVLIDRNDHVTFVERTFNEGKFAFDNEFKFTIQKIS